MGNQKIEQEYHRLWRSPDQYHWLDAMSLPTLSWVRPFLPLLGLPTPLVEQPDIWTPIYEQISVEYRNRSRELSNLAIEVREQAEAQLLYQLISKALFKLAEELGQEVAVDFEHWVRRHFLCHEVELGMNAWQSVLRAGCAPPNSRYDQVPPPDVLLAILPEIKDLVSLQHRIEINEAIEKVAPPPPYEQIPYERMVYCYETLLVQKAAEQTSTMKALQLIAARLNDSDRAEVITWAVAQAEAIRPTIKPRLKGNKYLQTELPCSDLLSVFDLRSSIDQKNGIQAPSF